MDIGQSIFEYGQSYVALSRIRSLDGLYLSAFNSKKIGANQKVSEFYNTIPKNTLPILQENEDDIINKDSQKEAPEELEEESYKSKDVKVIKF